MTSRSCFGKMNSTLGSVVPLAMFLYNQVDGEAFVTPKEALKRKEFYMLWVTRSQNPPFSIFYFKCVSQVLCRPDHSVCVRLLQSVRPKLYRGRSFPVFCRSGELCLQLHWKAFLWHSHGQVQTCSQTFTKTFSKTGQKTFSFPAGHHKSQDKLPHSDGGGDGALDRLGGHPLHHLAPWQGETLTNVNQRHLYHLKQFFFQLLKNVWVRSGSLFGSGRFMQLFRELTQPSLQ